MKTCGILVFSLLLSGCGGDYTADSGQDDDDGDTAVEDAPGDAADLEAGMVDGDAQRDDATGDDEGEIEICGGECRSGLYTACTCDAGDPCAWRGNGVCDSGCADVLPDGHFDDSADCILDEDSDGMDDGMEAALAEKYEPYLWFSSTEDFRKNRFPFFAVEPVEGDVTSIYYALSYFRDYGDPDLGGLTSHLGDSEFIVINLWENPEGEWVPQDLFLSAHYHAISDSSSRHLFGEFETFEDETGNVHPVVYASEWKHGNYISLEACAAGALGQDRCNRGVLERAGIELWKNIGNQDVQLIDEAEYSGNSEFYWSDIRFCGWQVGSILNSDRNLCTDSSYSSSIMPWLTGAL